MSGHADEAASLVSRLSVQADKLSPDAVLDAFRPASPSHTRAALILQLSQTEEDLVALFSSALAARLGGGGGGDDKNDGESSANAFAAIRFMTCLFSVAPDAAQSLVSDAGIVARVLDRSAAAFSKDSLLAFVTAELLCAAANHRSSRRWVLSESQGAKADTSKIVEIDEAREEPATVMHWLLSVVERANVENASSGSLLSKTALLSALALHKLQRGSKGEDNEEQGGEQAEERSEKDKRREEDELLFELSKEHVIQDETEHAYLTVPDGKLEESTRHELERVCRLSAIEGLTYLTLDASFKDAVAECSELLLQLVQLYKRGEGKPKALFPGRQESKGQGTSSYELDKTLTSPQQDDRRLRDSALQYGMATLLANVMAYPPLLSTEEKQMDRLKRMASAKSKVQGGASSDTHEEADVRMSTAAIEGRVQRVLAAGGAATLSAIAMDSTRTSASGTIRETVARALLAMTTRQDKIQRGKIVQQGGARAVLALSNHALTDALRQSDKGDKAQGSPPGLPAMQALAHLLITENPSLVLQNAAEAIPALVCLYVHSRSSRLQRFEAALALTNVASLGEEMTRAAATCAFPRAAVDMPHADDFAGAGAKEQSKTKVQLVDVLHERVFLEDNEMSRRASLELLCNLLVDERFFRRWSGEDEDEALAQESDKGQIDDMRQGRVIKDLVFLVALCAPVGTDMAFGESGLKIRLAASGAVATLCSSPSTCARLLAVESRVLNKLSGLVYPLSANNGQGEEADLHAQDLSDDTLGPDHAALQLALRGLTCLDCLIQYVAWLQTQGSRDITVYKHTLVEAGCVNAIKALALSLTKRIQAPSPIAAIHTLEQQVTHQSFEALRACKSLGLV